MELHMLDHEIKYQVRSAYREEWEEAMELAWDTFMEFEANDYSAKGIKSFREFITDKLLRRMFIVGSYQLFIAVDERDKIIGLISLRSQTHISLLFVDKQYHKKGIGRKLIDYLCDYVEQYEGVHRVTVNAAPYAVGFYHKLGFQDIGFEQTSDGITFTPMELKWKKGRRT